MVIMICFIISQDNPKGILRSEGSASKPNRVVFSTPIEQKGAVPSDSDTSVLDMEVCVYSSLSIFWFLFMSATLI